jgi:tRNA-dihydrouridine synthase/endonuclease/exonuclease/phosphatase family metal-dependent hydrolase
MLAAHLFAKQAQYRRTFFATLPEDRPLAVQFCGNDPETLLAAAKIVDGQCDYIDLNLGCPQQMAKRGYYGAFIMEDWPLIRKIIRLLKSELTTPISCKIRIFRSLKRTVAFARSLESAGCSLLAVHGRLRDQKGRGLADWHTIRAVRAAVNIPVIANGNILAPSDVDLCLESTGAAGVMCAETLLHNPCIFASAMASPPPVWTVAMEYLVLCDQLCVTVNVDELVASCDTVNHESGSSDGSKVHMKPPLPISWVRAHLVRLFHHLLSYHADRLPADFETRIASRTLNMTGCYQLVNDVRAAFDGDVTADNRTSLSPSPSPPPELPTIFACRARIRKGQVRKDPLDGSAELAALAAEEEKRIRAAHRQQNAESGDTAAVKKKRGKKRKKNEPESAVAAASASAVGEADMYRLLAKLGQEERHRLKVDLATAQRKNLKLAAKAYSICEVPAVAPQPVGPPAFPALCAAQFPPLPPLAAATSTIRMGCYNIRVDHDADEGTEREWPNRRPLAAAAIKRIDCDLLLLQEPGPVMGQQLADDLGSAFAVDMQPCNPIQWNKAGPKQGQDFDGNGFIWKTDRIELVGNVETFWFSVTPDRPNGSAWDGSPHCRCGMEATFKVKTTGHLIHAFSVHFDHIGKQARAESAKMLMHRASLAAMNAQEGTTVVVGGDFNTFPDAFGPETYDALSKSGEAAGMCDIRSLSGVKLLDFGVGSSSWKGWKGQPFSREQNLKEHGQRRQDASRFDHLFLQKGARVTWAGVLEEPEWAGGSDHVPIVFEMLL